MNYSKIIQFYLLCLLAFISSHALINEILFVKIFSIILIFTFIFIVLDNKINFLVLPKCYFYLYIFFLYYMCHAFILNHNILSGRGADAVFFLLGLMPIIFNVNKNLDNRVHLVRILIFASFIYSIYGLIVFTLNDFHFKYLPQGRTIIFVGFLVSSGVYYLRLRIFKNLFLSLISKYLFLINFFLLITDTSRGLIITCLLLLTFYELREILRPSRKRTLSRWLLIYTPLITLIFILDAGSFEKLITRLETLRAPLNNLDVSLQYRINALQAGLDSLESNLFFGSGLGTRLLFYSPLKGDLNGLRIGSLHLYWLQLMVNFGIIGFLLFCLVIYQLFKSLQTYTTNNEYELIRFLFFISSIAFMTGISVTVFGLFSHMLLWLLLSGAFPSNFRYSKNDQARS